MSIHSLFSNSGENVSEESSIPCNVPHKVSSRHHGVLHDNMVEERDSTEQTDHKSGDCHKFASQVEATATIVSVASILASALAYASLSSPLSNALIGTLCPPGFPAVNQCR